MAGSGDIVAVSNGLPLDAAGKLLVDGGAVVSTQNGLPYTAAGLIAVNGVASGGAQTIVTDGEGATLLLADGSTMVGAGNISVVDGALVGVLISANAAVITDQESYLVNGTTYTFTISGGIITDIATA